MQTRRITATSPASRILSTSSMRTTANASTNSTSSSQTAKLQARSETRTLRFVARWNGRRFVVGLVDDKAGAFLGELVDFCVLRLLLVAFDVLERAEEDNFFAVVYLVGDVMPGTVCKLFGVEKNPVIAEIGEVGTEQRSQRKLSSSMTSTWMTSPSSTPTRK